ncbi:MAG: hypothetical protein PWP37_1649 [Thermotogota bacterium]|nr:hypothetical protein [Thermotogota bacterium]MDK2865457.1 hypothetical protein [Thermotogota bacterium]HCZ05730.1 peptidase M24 [Thermotogota bacterium]
MEEFEVKVERLRKLMKKRELKGVLLSRVENFAWITCGGRSWVVTSNPVGVASVLVTENAVYMISNNIEMERLLKEETPSGSLFTPLEYRWYESEEKVLSTFDLSNTGSDTGAYGTLDVSGDIKKLRVKLTPWEIERYRKFGEELQMVFEEAVDTFHPDMTEFEASGILQNAMFAHGFEAPVLLVFGDESRKLYRHNIPRDVKLGNTFFASTCAGKGGLILALTRMVSFVNDAHLEDQYLKNAMIDAEEFLESLEGRRLNEMFNIIKGLYEKQGVAEQFELHHQGGTIAYLPREEISTPSSETILESNMAVAWNPTITGTKLEDTILITEAGNEYVTFTEKSKWPVLELNVNGTTVKRPGILKK